MSALFQNLVRRRIVLWNQHPRKKMRPVIFFVGINFNFLHDPTSRILSCSRIGVADKMDP